MESQQEEDAIAAHKRMAKSLLRCLSSVAPDAPHHQSQPPLSSTANSPYDSVTARHLAPPTNTLPPRATVAAGDLAFHYLVDGDVAVLVLCDRPYPRLLAFGFLAEIHRAFLQEARASSPSASASAAVRSALRPYSYIRF
ncbi:Vesicle-trafficking protein S22a, partial [Cladochytrium tenue]